MSAKATSPQASHAKSEPPAPQAHEENLELNQQDRLISAKKLMTPDSLHPQDVVQLQRTLGNQAVMRLLRPAPVQRVVEMRPPGRGEATAFERRQEIVDRMNGLTTGVRYRLEGRVLAHEVLDENALTPFDRQMIDFIGRGAVVPMRLITSAGRVNGQNVEVDFYDAGYVDVDDLMASDDHSFQMNLIHLLEERFRTSNYDRRIGTTFSDAEFNRAHRAGIEAEAEYLRGVTGDPTLRFVYEETRPNGTNVFGYRSREGYSIFHVIRNAGRAVRGGNVFAQTADGRQISIEELVQERAAAADAEAH